MAFHGGREGKGNLRQIGRMILRIQLKQTYEEYGWNANRNERRGGEHSHHFLGYDWRRITKGDGRG